MNEPIITIYTIAPCSARRSIYQVELTRARLSLSYLICPTKRPINKMFNFINIIYLLLSLLIPALARAFARFRTKERRQVDLVNLFADSYTRARAGPQRRTTI